MCENGQSTMVCIALVHWEKKQSEHYPLLQYLENFDNIMNYVFLIILGQLKLDLVDEKWQCWKN